MRSTTSRSTSRRRSSPETAAGRNAVALRSGEPRRAKGSARGCRFRGRARGPHGAGDRPRASPTARWGRRSGCTWCTPGPASRQIVRVQPASEVEIPPGGAPVRVDRPSQEAGNPAAPGECAKLSSARDARYGSRWRARSGTQRADGDGAPTPHSRGAGLLGPHRLGGNGGGCPEGVLHRGARPAAGGDAPRPPHPSLRAALRLPRRPGAPPRGRREAGAGDRATSAIGGDRRHGRRHRGHPDRRAHGGGGVGHHREQGAPHLPGGNPPQPRCHPRRGGRAVPLGDPQRQRGPPAARAPGARRRARRAGGPYARAVHHQGPGFLTRLGRELGPPWTADHKAATLAAILALG